MSLPIISFPRDMDLKTRVKLYARYCVTGGLRFDSDKAKKEVTRFFEAFESGRSIVSYGNPGTGKTLLFELIRRVTNYRARTAFLILPTSTVVENLDTDGHEYLRRLWSGNVLFDDLGAEKETMYYGNRTDVFEYIIRKRYELWKNEGLATYFTTNLKPEEIKLRYGTRAWERLEEMAEHILVDDGDKRKLNNWIGFPQVITQKTEEDEAFEKAYLERMKSAKSQKPERRTLGDLAREQFGNMPKLVASSNAGKLKKK